MWAITEDKRTFPSLPSSLGGGMEPLVYDSISCFFAEAVKDVQGVTVRAQTQPAQAWPMELWPLRRDGRVLRARAQRVTDQAQTED